MTERLADKNPCNTCQKSCSLDYECEERALYEYDCMKKLAEYETAEEEERVVILPCKIGTPVYFLRHGFDGWHIDKKKFTYGMIGKVGKTIFLTLEGAQEALKDVEE